MKKSGVFLVAASTVALLSCTSAIDPFVPYPERFSLKKGLPPDNEPTLDSNSSLARAMARLYAARKTLETYAAEQTQILTASKSGTFAGAVGALVSGVYGGSRDMIVGFGLGGGGSYALGQLYGPAGYAAAYRTGLRALRCIDETASPVWAGLGPLRRHRDELDVNVKNLERLIQAARKNNRNVENKELADAKEEVKTAEKHLGILQEKNKNNEKNINAASADLDKKRERLAMLLALEHVRDSIHNASTVLTEGTKTRVNADKILVVEGPIAARVNGATERIIDNVNARIELQQPDAAAAALARSIGQFGLSGIDTAKKTALDLGAGVRRPLSATSAAMGLSLDDTKALLTESQRNTVDELKSAEEKVAAARAVVEKAIETFKTGTTEDSIRLALETCKIDDLTVAVLTKTPGGEIELDKNKTAPYDFSFTVSGGQAPYLAVFLGSKPNEIEINPSTSWTGAFTIKVKNTITTDFQTEIEIRDATAKNPAKLAVVVKSKAAAAAAGADQ